MLKASAAYLHYSPFSVFKRLTLSLKQKTPPGKIPQRRMSDRYPINKKIWQPGCHSISAFRPAALRPRLSTGLLLYSGSDAYQSDMVMSRKKLIIFYLQFSSLNLL